MKYKKLIIAPHADDDVLGCGGIFDKDCLILYCGIDESSVRSNRPSYDDRTSEIEKAKNFTGHEYKILNNLVNHYDDYELIDQVEKVVEEVKPEEVYLPHPSYNQDHRAVYDGCMVALRPHDKNFFVKKIFVYEQPHMLFWDNEYVDYKPNYFVPIDIDKKVKLYEECFKSQVRGFRSVEHVKAIARLRGGQSNCEYAEAYKILRWVD